MKFVSRGGVFITPARHGGLSTGQAHSSVPTIGHSDHAATAIMSCPFDLASRCMSCSTARGRSPHSGEAPTQFCGLPPSWIRAYNPSALSPDARCLSSELSQHCRKRLTLAKDSSTMCERTGDAPASTRALILGYGSRRNSCAARSGPLAGTFKRGSRTRTRLYESHQTLKGSYPILLSVLKDPI